MSVCVSMNLLLFKTRSGKGTSRRRGRGDPGKEAGRCREGEESAGSGRRARRRQQATLGELEGNGARCKRRLGGQEGSGLQFAPRAAALILEEPAETGGGGEGGRAISGCARRTAGSGGAEGGRRCRGKDSPGGAHRRRGCGAASGWGPEGGAPVEGRGGGRGAWGGGPEPLSEPPGSPRLPPMQEATTPRAPSRLQQQQQQ